MTILEVLPRLLVTIAADKNKNSGKYSEEISDTRRKCFKKSKKTLIAPILTMILIQILNSKKTSNDTLIIEKRLSDYPQLIKKFDSFKSEVLQ
jgi:hypothetical protein